MQWLWWRRQRLENDVRAFWKFICGDFSGSPGIFFEDISKKVRTLSEYYQSLWTRSKNCWYLKWCVFFCRRDSWPRGAAASCDPLVKHILNKEKLHMIRALHPFVWSLLLPPFSRSLSLATVNCARALHFHEILAGLYCHLRSLFLLLLTNLQLLSDSEAGLGLMHGDGGASNRLGATRIDEDSVRGAETNMLQSACCVWECVRLCVGGGAQEAGWDELRVTFCLTRAHVLSYISLHGDD